MSNNYVDYTPDNNNNVQMNAVLWEELQNVEVGIDGGEYGEERLA